MRRSLRCEFLVTIFAHMKFHKKLTRLSCDFGPSGHLHRVQQQERGVGLEEERENLAGKVDLLSQMLYLDFHPGES